MKAPLKNQTWFSFHRVTPSLRVHLQRVKPPVVKAPEPFRQVNVPNLASSGIAGASSTQPAQYKPSGNPVGSHHLLELQAVKASVDSIKME
tara:strand:+ start:277 stop:549 length:273 start_codon:yes stop_codon:yes gene_type:complete